MPRLGASAPFFMSPPRSDLTSTPQAAGAAQRAYSALKHELVRGRYRPGDRIDIDSFREELGVSKQPIMEGLRRLSAEGLVEIVPQVGCNVARYERADVVDFFALMGAVEGTAAALAAVRRTDAQLLELADINEQMWRTCAELRDGGDPESYRLLNRHFHSRIHRMAVTDIVEEIGSALYDRADFFLYSSARQAAFPEIVDQLQQGHEAILHALTDRDPQVAEQAARSHSVVVIESILDDRATALPEAGA
jgi:DNA-binding GntR family transcriptional regulator